MTKEGYQPIKTKKTIKIIPPNTGSNVQINTWKDLNRSYWEGFDNAKNKMEKRIAELEKENAELIQENEEIKKGLGCETCQIHLGFTKLNQKITELKALIKSEHEIEARKNNNLISQLDKAKEMLRWFLIYEKGSGIITNFNNFLNEVAEFINYTE